MKDTVKKDILQQIPSFREIPDSIAPRESPGEVSFAASTAANTSIDQKDAAVEDSTAAQ